MKLMKTKLGLSVLALALVGAGVMSLPSSATTSANVDTTGFEMQNGASVASSDDFSGIRWTTTVEPSFYNASGASASSKFGVIVAPTAQFTGELTHATTLTSGGSVKDLPVNGSIIASESAVNYYSVIDYSGLAVSDEEKAEAYKMELTARAYVDVDGNMNTVEDRIYANVSSEYTSRSARQVAIANDVHDGSTDYSIYYGNKTYTREKESIGAVGTPYIDMENPQTAVGVSITVDGTIEEVLVGTKSVTYTYEGTTLTITDATGISCGEQYVTVFTSNGIVTAPIIGATKVFDEMKDFEAFKYIRKNLKKNSSGGYKVYYEVMETDVDGNPIDASKLVHDGYYVLAGDLDIDTDTSGYDATEHMFTATKTVVEKVKETVDGEEVTTEVEKQVPIHCEGYYGVSNFVGKPLGLTGTFNGLGNTISDYQIKRSNSGLFELINGGTIKNFALWNAKQTTTDYENNPYSNASGLACYAIDPTIENVFMTNTSNFFADEGNFLMCTHLYQSKAGSSLLRNVYAVQKYKNGSGTRAGGLFGYLSGNTKKFAWENVYVQSPAGLSISWDSSKSGSVTTVTLNYCYGDAGEQVADNELGYTAYYWDKTELPPDTSKKKYVAQAYKFTGVSVFYSDVAMYNYVQEKDSKDNGKGLFAKFVSDPSGCWKTKTMSVSITEEVDGVSQTVTKKCFIPTF